MANVRYLRDKQRATTPKSERTPAQIALAKRFKDWRLNRGLTMKEAADLLGVAVITIKHWESCVNLIRPHVFKMIDLLDETLPPKG